MVRCFLSTECVAQQLPQDKTASTPKRANSQGYHNDIWATSDVSSSMEPSAGQTETHNKLGIKLLLFVRRPE